MARWQHSVTGLIINRLWLQHYDNVFQLDPLIHLQAQKIQPRKIRNYSLRFFCLDTLQYSHCRPAGDSRVNDACDTISQSGCRTKF